MNADSSKDAFRALVETLIVVDRLRLRSWDASDFTISQLRLLALLRDSEGLSNTSAARLLNVQPSSVTRICDRLVERELVARLPDPKDGRGVRLVITVKGVLAVRAIQADAREFLGGVFDRMKPDAVTMLVKGLRSFRDAAAAEDAPPWWASTSHASSQRLGPQGAHPAVKRRKRAAKPPGALGELTAKG